MRAEGGLLLRVGGDAGRRARFGRGSELTVRYCITTLSRFPHSIRNALSLSKQVAA